MGHMYFESFLAIVGTITTLKDLWRTLKAHIRSTQIVFVIGSKFLHLYKTGRKV
jgi:hypothetical protein